MTSVDPIAQTMNAGANHSSSASAPATSSRRDTTKTRTKQPSPCAAAILVALLTSGASASRASASRASSSSHVMTSACLRNPPRRPTKHHPSVVAPRMTHSLCVNDMRGGAVGGGGDPAADAPPPFPPTYPGDRPQQMAPPATISAPPSGVGDYNNMTNGGPAGAMNDPMYEYRNTVEDRIDAWRKQQQKMQEEQTDREAASVVDDQGRLKFFTVISRTSVAFFFFILTWRTVHLYELADTTFARRGSGTGLETGYRSLLLRTVVVAPLVLLFLGEMVGAMLGMMGGSPSGATKRRLKGVLNLHKGVELVMMIYSVVRMLIWPSNYVIREVYVGRAIMSIFFLTQANLYTKLAWDGPSKSTIGEGGYATESYYDDYVPDATDNYGEDPWQASANAHQYGERYYDEGAQAPPQRQQPLGHPQQYDRNTSGQT